MVRGHTPYFVTATGLAMNSANSRGFDELLLEFYSEIVRPYDGIHGFPFVCQKLRGLRNIIPKMGPSRNGRTALPLHWYTTL